MGLVDYWKEHFDERDTNLVRLGEILYEGDFDSMTKDMVDRLISNPMYDKLERRLIEDLERMDKIKYLKDLEELYTKEDT